MTVIPPSPVLLWAEAVAGDTIRVKWTFSGSADTFEIERYDRLMGAPAWRAIGTAAASTDYLENRSLPATT